MFRASRLATAVIALGCVVATQDAQAQCAPDPAVANDDVICSGADVDGFSAPVDVDDIDVTVEDTATVDGGAATSAILLNDNSRVTNDGTITLATDDGSAVVTGNVGNVFNTDTITASGADGRAVEVGNDSNVTNDGGTLTGGSDGPNSTGYAVWFNGGDTAVNTLTNRNGGVIQTTGQIAIEGSDAREIIVHSGGSVITGGIRLNGGDDQVTISGMATVSGDIDLGDGTDVIGFDSAAGSTLPNDIIAGAGNDSGNFAGTTDFTGTFFGGDGDDTVNVFEDAAVNGGTFDLGAGNDDFNLLAGGSASFLGTLDAGDGDDDIVIEAGLSFTGTIDLGAGNDDFTVENTATVDTDGVDLMAGDGNDQIFLRGTGDVGTPGGARFIGNIDLGETEVDGQNLLQLEINAEMTGNVVGGANVDNLELQRGAMIDGTITLGDGADIVDAATDSTVTGAIDLGAGDDSFTVSDSGGTSFMGSIDLGAGDDDFIVQNLATFDTNGVDLLAGDGDDEVFLRGTGDVGTPGGARFIGNIDLGETEVDGQNLLRLRVNAELDGNVIGGGGVDNIEMFEGALIDGDITLAAGDDTLAVSIGSAINGTIDLGADNDTIQVGNDAVITGAIVLGEGDNILQGFDRTTITGNVSAGAGADSVSLGTDSVLTGSMDLGAGNDTLTLDPGVDVTGAIDLGAGDDTFRLKPVATFPTNLTNGAGSDTLQLDALPLSNQVAGVVDLTEVQTGLGADGFEALLVGPDSGAGVPPFGWTVSTTAPTNFDDGITLQSGALTFGGSVELTGDFTQQTASTTSMAFNFGQGFEDSMLVLDGALTIEASDFGDPDIDSDDRLAIAEITFLSSVVEGDYTLIETTGGITGDFGRLLFPDIAAFEFASGIVGNDYILAVTRISTYDDFARGQSQENLGVYLEEARVLAGAGAFSDFTAELDTLSERDLQTALAQLNAESYDAHTSSVLAWGREQQRVLQQRPMHCDRFTYAPRPEIVSASPCGARGIMPWAKVVGNLARHKGGEPSGYDVMSGGVLMGFDHRVGDRLWWSGDIGFGHVEIENDNDAEGKFESVDLGVAAGTVYRGFQVRGSLSYSHGFHEMERKIDFLGERAKADFDSDRVTLAAAASYRQRLGALVVEPGVTVDYTHVEEESVEESGEDVIALDLDARKTDVFAATAGVKLSTAILKYRYVGEWLEWADGVWTPSVNVQWRQAFGDVDRDLTAEIQGAPGGAGDFDSEASDSNGGLEVGGRIAFQPLGTGASVEAGYDGYFGDDVTNHSANVSVRIPF